MSKTVKCPHCGQDMEVPAFEGDGAYSRHVCEQRSRDLAEWDELEKRDNEPWPDFGST